VASIIDALNDTPVAVPATGGTIPSVVMNDTKGVAAVVLGTNASLIAGTAPMVTAGSIQMNAAGVITVGVGTPPDIYSYPYTICTIPATIPTATCDTAVATVVVAATIDAVNDSPLPIAASGGTTPSVINNDTTNGGVAVVLGTNASLTAGTAPTVTSGSIQMNTAGVITVGVGTAPGIYSYPYTICTIPATIPTATCDTATATVVVAPSISPVRDISTPTTAGNAATPIENVAANDTVNGAPATLGPTGNATVEQSGTWPIGITLDPMTGAIKTSAAVPPGVYDVTYLLCDKNTPVNCALMTNSITVQAGLTISGAAWIVGAGGNTTNPSNLNSSGVSANSNNVPLPGFVAIIVDVTNPSAPIPLGAATVDALGNYTIPNVPVATAANKNNYRVIFIDPTAVQQLQSGNLPSGNAQPSLLPITGATPAAGGSVPLNVAGLNLLNSSGGLSMPTSAGGQNNVSGTPATTVGSLRNALPLSPTLVSTPASVITRVDLPIDPSGVVYDSVSRTPVPNPTIRICRADGVVMLPAELIGGDSFTQDGKCLKRQYLGNEGMYAFMVTNPGSYTIAYLGNGTALYPANATTTGTSAVIAPQTGAANNTVNGSNDALGGNTTVDIQTNAIQPTAAQSTTYYTTFTLAAGGGDVIHNHLPIDPIIIAKLAISKTGDKTSAEVGDSVRYTITVKRLDTGAGAVASSQVVDYLPAGFRYIDGTAQVNGVSIADPTGKPAPKLVFNLGALPTNGTATLTYRVRLGVGAQQGTGINRAQATAGTNVNCAAQPSLCSNEAQYKVKVTDGVFSNQACVTGKVYLDCNNNHMQDGQELGIPGVRLYMENGINFTTDVEGKYSYCGLQPRTSVLVIDQTTLPQGSVMTTSTSRNAGDAMSLFLDLKNGDLQRADFIETSCSPEVLEQVKARRGKDDANLNGVGIQKPSGKVIEFDSKPSSKSIAQ
jgi:uncharacterized repeat protein (TIGR01451 family)